MAAHKIFGPSTSVFASDFIISRASRMLTYNFDNPYICQLFSTAIYNLVYGELLQADKEIKSESNENFNFIDTNFKKDRI